MRFDSSHKVGCRKYAAGFIGEATAHLKSPRILTIPGENGFEPRSSFEWNLARDYPTTRIIAVDSDVHAIEACDRNIAMSSGHWGGRIDTIHADIDDDPVCRVSGVFADFCNSFYSKAFQRHMAHILDSLDTRITTIPLVVVAVRNRCGRGVPKLFKGKPESAMAWSLARLRFNKVHWNPQLISTMNYRDEARGSQKTNSPMVMTTYLLHRRAACTKRWA